MLRNGLAVPESGVFPVISSKRPLLLLKILWVPPVTVKVSRKNDKAFASSSAQKLRCGALTNYYELVVHSDDSNSTSEDGASSTDKCDAEDFSENDGVEDSYEEMRKHTTGYRFVDLEILQELFLETAVCKYCKEGSLHIKGSKCGRSGIVYGDGVPVLRSKDFKNPGQTLWPVLGHQQDDCVCNALDRLWKGSPGENMWGTKHATSSL